MERPSRTPAPRHRRLPSSIDMPTMRRPPSAPPPREGSRPLLSPLQSAARALLPCAVYAWPPHASRLGAQKDGLGAAVTMNPDEPGSPLAVLKASLASLLEAQAKSQ